MQIKEISANETWELRQRVMWPNKDLEHVKLADDDQGFHYGGFKENKLITVVSLFYNDKQVQFRKFATSKTEQKQGFGTKLLEYIIAEAKGRGAELIWCNARLDKVDFYQRFGLEPKGEFFERDGKKYMRMSKLLK